MKNGGAQGLCRLLELALQAVERRLLQLAGARTRFSVASAMVSTGIVNSLSDRGLRAQESSSISPGTQS